MNTLSHKKEQQHSPSSAASPAQEQREKNLENAAVRNAAAHVETSLGNQDLLSGMEGNEIKEKANGTAGENPPQQSSTWNQQTQSTQNDARQQLQNKTGGAVTQKVMVRKIKHALTHEIRKREKQIRKLQRQAKQFAYELSEAFQQLRTLRNLLQDISTFTRDFIQMLFGKVCRQESLATIKY